MATVTMNFEEQCAALLAYLSLSNTAEFSYYTLVPDVAVKELSHGNRLVVRLPTGDYRTTIPSFDLFVQLAWDSRGVDPSTDVPDHQWRDHKCMAVTCTSKADQCADQYETGRYVKQDQLEETAAAIDQYLTTGVKPEFFK